jgi:hypothetical protein
MSNIKKEYKSCYLLNSVVENLLENPTSILSHIKLHLESTNPQTNYIRCQAKYTNILDNEIREGTISKQLSSNYLDEIKALNPEIVNGITPCLNGYHEIEMFKDQFYTNVLPSMEIINVCIRDDIYSKMMGEVNLSDADTLA